MQARFVAVSVGEVVLLLEVGEEETVTGEIAALLEVVEVELEVGVEEEKEDIMGPSSHHNWGVCVGLPGVLLVLCPSSACTLYLCSLPFAFSHLFFSCFSFPLIKHFRIKRLSHNIHHSPTFTSSAHLFHLHINFPSIRSWPYFLYISLKSRSTSQICWHY